MAVKRCSDVCRHKVWNQVTGRQAGTGQSSIPHQTVSRRKDATFDKSDFRSIVPRFTSEALDANQVLVDLLKEVANQKQATAAQIALSWILAQKPWIVPIPGTTKLSRLEENIAAADIELTQDELKRIDETLAQIQVAGDRYPEELEKRTGL